MFSLDLGNFVLRVLFFYFLREGWRGMFLRFFFGFIFVFLGNVRLILFVYCYICFFIDLFFDDLIFFCFDFEEVGRIGFGVF